MSCADQYLEPRKFEKPTNVEFVEIDAHNGRRASAQCPKDQRVWEVYLKGTEPLSECPLHGDPYRDSQTQGNGSKNKSNDRKSIWDLVFGD
ncbi:MAG: hypothetical protein KDD62_06300, partial [Bdellovibrionales bacterium]|nr:hypothetical protein [Bdellovibrionales bacterium]